MRFAKLSTLLTIVLSLALTAPAAIAESKALLVTVGNYQSNEIPDLRAVDNDLRIMQDLLQNNPKLNGNISVLCDANVSRALRDLVAGLKAGDLGLFYFSGHGAQFDDNSGDEADQRDEGLIMYDASWQLSSGQAKNVLLDDELMEIYDSVNGGKLVVLIDACNSGTFHRGMLNAGDEDQIKSPGYVAASVVDTDRARGSQNGELGEIRGYVALHAADDDEQALLSPNGSYFTLGLQQVHSQVDLSLVTTQQLREDLSRYIADSIPADRIAYQPQLQGDKVLFERGLINVDDKSNETDTATRVWQKLQQVADKYATPKMQIRSDDTDNTIPSWQLLYDRSPSTGCGLSEYIVFRQGQRSATGTVSQRLRAGGSTAPSWHLRVAASRKTYGRFRQSRHRRKP